MRHILQGFTMHFEQEDFGFDTEEVTIPIPTPKTEPYAGGGSPLAVNLPLAQIEALEVSVKMAGKNPKIMQRLAEGPGNQINFHFRAGVLNEIDGSVVAHLVTVRGSANGGSQDTWTRGAKSGLEFMVNGVTFFHYTVAGQTIHKISAWPPEWITNGRDQMRGLTRALGYQS